MVVFYNLNDLLDFETKIKNELYQLNQKHFNDRLPLFNVQIDRFNQWKIYRKYLFNSIGNNCTLA